jgi:hypothetical protein
MPRTPQAIAVSDSAGEGVFEVAFGDFAREAEEFEVGGVFGYLLGEL